MIASLEFTQNSNMFNFRLKNPKKKEMFFDQRKNVISVKKNVTRITMLDASARTNEKATLMHSKLPH